MPNIKRGMMGAAGAGGVVAADFDGTNDYLSIASDFSGIADSKILSMSFWFKNAGVPDAEEMIFYTTGLRLQLEIDDDGGDNVLVLNTRDSVGDNVVRVTIRANDTGAAVWHHFCVSFDASNSSNRGVFLDDSATYGNWYIYEDLDIEFTKGSHTLGGQDAGGNRYTGALYDFWLNMGGTRVDFETTATRRKFISAAGEPVDLGSDGSTPGFGSPTLFLTGEIDTWHTNAGSGGGMTENGELTEVSGPVTAGSA